MSEEIKVSVVEFGDRSCYQLQWIDPATGLKKTKSSKIQRGGKKEQAAATRAARDLEKDLNDGLEVNQKAVSWEAFKERYTLERADHLAAATAGKVGTVFSLVDRLMIPPPKRLADLTASRLSEWVSRLATEKDGTGPDAKPLRTAATVASHCRHLRAALRWAAKMGLLRRVPDIVPPKSPKGKKLMKGRPITGEEFDRMIAAVPAALTPEKPRPTKRNPNPAQPEPSSPAVVAQWRRFLTGLWWSGLRLNEALRLSWDASAAVSVLMVPGYRPAFRFRADGHKAGEPTLTPIAPEFVNLLEAVPEAEREGLVFPLPVRTKEGVSAIISAIGAKAGVVVDPASGKTASAHDFRRAFGTRWAKRIMPEPLKELMRHESIETTLKYYISQRVEDTAALLWAAFERESNTQGNTCPILPDGCREEIDASSLSEKDLAKLPRLDSNQE